MLFLGAGMFFMGFCWSFVDVERNKEKRLLVYSY